MFNDVWPGAIMDSYWYQVAWPYNTLLDLRFSPSTRDCTRYTCLHKGQSALLLIVIQVQEFGMKRRTTWHRFWCPNYWCIRSIEIMPYHRVNRHSQCEIINFAITKTIWCELVSVMHYYSSSIIWATLCILSYL